MSVRAYDVRERQRERELYIEYYNPACYQLPELKNPQSNRAANLHNKLRLWHRKGREREPGRGGVSRRESKRKGGVGNECRRKCKIGKCCGVA